ncbi:DUF4402 domain-containing protein [Sphingomonas sp. G124]|jgi:hypothetical protein|uniref:DUF4402 domain-containing protein n=1 Tax=Sphingomonas cremea TaxID=2904799 RepID=A0A9X1TX87_9SPHN|nr:DUF4402 domain-containing protein [Sphingomonas cremea]MCF2514900.1 DUF4402 domain-containing protein [Sphingomonas cremea]
MFRAARVSALISLFSVSLPAAAAAAPVQASPTASAQVVLVRPLTLVRTADMDFALLGVTTGGTATIDPVTGAMSVTGGLIHLGGTPSPARYSGAASKQTVVNIKVPKAPVLIRRVGGTETLSVSNFTLDGQDKKILAQQQSFTFAVGAQIAVPAGTVEGLYTGQIDVTVQYP